MADRAITILLIEDDPAHAQVLQRLLAVAGGARFTLQWADRLGTGIERLIAGRIDLILLDLVLPDSQGLDTLTRIQARAPRVPVVVLTGLDDETLGVEAVHQGAQDYLIKGEVEARSLVRSIHYAIKRRQAEDAARRSEARKAAIFESSLDALITMDHTGTIVEFNPAAEKTFGYRQAEVIGKELGELLVPPGLRERHRRGLERYLATGHEVILNQRVELTALRGDCTEFPIELAITRIQTERPPLFIGYVRDISERKRAEHELVQRARLGALDAEIGITLSTSAPLRSILQQCADTLVRHLDGMLARIWILNDLEKVLELQAGAGMARSTEIAPRRIPVERCITDSSSARPQPLLSDALLVALHPPDQAWPRVEGIAAVTHALIIENRLVGVMELVAGQPLTPAALQVLGPLADGIAQCIERKRAEEALRQAEAKYRGIFENAVEGIFQSTPEGRFLTANPAMAGILGFSSPAELIANVSDIGQQLHVDPQRRSELGRLLEAHGLVQGFETRLYRRDGGMIWVSLSVRAVRDVEGRLLYYEGLAEDITRRKQAEDEKSRLVHHIRLLLDSTGEGIYGVDLQGRCTFINKAAAAMLGYPPEQVLGRNMHMLVHHSHPDGSPYPESECPIFRAFQAGQEVRLKGEVLWRRHGTAFLAEYSSYPVREAGVVTGAVVTFNDITERQHAEEALRQAEQALVRSTEELRIAGAIQRGLFPRTTPTLAGCDIAGTSWPANATGGDYADYITMPDGSLGLVIGDVSGHGLGPALIAASTRAYLRGFAMTQADVGQVLAQLNRVLVHDVGEGFVTLILVRLEPTIGRLVYASAGHPAVHVLDGSGAIKARLESTGLPLGIDPESTFPAGPPVMLEPGDLVLLLTDGVMEATAPDGTAFGIDRALDVVRAHRREPAGRIIAALHRAVRGFAQGMPQGDDITVMLLKIESTPGLDQTG